MNPQNPQPPMNKVAARRRIKDRGIRWKEVYKDRSKTLKKRFDHEIGAGSYYRFEGHDFTTNSDYYIVVGPTYQRELGKCFFAGIKKLPKDPNKKVYSPYGKYFTTILAALSHASNKWGTPINQNQIPYEQSALANVKITEHVKG
jgi:hypothetical protein